MTATGTSYGSTWTTGDIMGVAMDLDNNKLYFSKNGVLAKFRKCQHQVLQEQVQFPLTVADKTYGYLGFSS